MKQDVSDKNTPVDLSEKDNKSDNVLKKRKRAQEDAQPEGALLQKRRTEPLLAVGSYPKELVLCGRYFMMKNGNEPKYYNSNLTEKNNYLQMNTVYAGVTVICYMDFDKSLAFIQISIDETRPVTKGILDKLEEEAKKHELAYEVKANPGCKLLKSFKLENVPGKVALMVPFIEEHLFSDSGFALDSQGKTQTMRKMFHDAFIAFKERCIKPEAMQTDSLCCRF